MKKFVYTYHGAWVQEKEVQDGWMAWFQEIGDHIVDNGNPLGNGRVLTGDGERELNDADSPAIGYTIVNAEDMEQAVKLLENCPNPGSIRIYEADVM